MWRFILVCFGFLGFAFYELSGGADYKPHENSIQVRKVQPSPVAVAELEPVKTPSIAELAKTAPKVDDNRNLGITLASVRLDESTLSNQIEPKSVKVTATDAVLSHTEQEALNTAEDEAEKIWPGAIELFMKQEQRREDRAAAALALQKEEVQADIRIVTGTVVNMRGGPGTEFAPLGTLTEGTEVAVLTAAANGWLMLRVTETGQEGWMADWLVSAAAN